jgi:hypothetical protein
MVEYIDMTPTWRAILPSWQMIVNDAVKVKKPDQMERFWTEMQSMANAADRWNDYCRGQLGAQEANPTPENQEQSNG